VSPDGPRRRSRLAGPSARSIQAFCQRHDIELPTVAAGAWALLLALYSRQDDVLFGSGGSLDASQLRPERTRLGWDLDAATWLRSLDQASRRRREAGPVPLDEARAWSDVPEGIPLLESVLVVGEPTSRTGRWPLVVGVRPGRRVHLWADADAGRFDEWILPRLLEHLGRAMEGLAADPPVPLGEIDLLDAQERERLLVEWNRTAVDHRSEATIPDLFAEHVAERPGAVAVASDERPLTYAQLDARSSQLARHLQGLGVARETVVGLCLERNEDVPVALLGVLKAGGTYLPLDPSHPAERLTFVLEDAGASFVITHRSLADRVDGAGGQSLVLEDLAEILDGEDPSPPECEATADSLAYIIYTSGSTGTPKGTEIPHRGVNRLVRAVDYMELGPETAGCHMLSLAFDASVLEIWAPLLNGGRLFVYPERVPTATGLAAAIARHGINTMVTSTAIFNTMVDEDPGCLQGVRQLMMGGEAMSPAHVRRAYSALPDLRIYNGYGPTECTVVTTCHTVPRDLPEDALSVPIGKPIRDTTVYVLDERMKPLPTGVMGELWVGGPGVARGYRGRPELNAERFVHDPFGEPGGRLYRTGDLVFWRPEGVLEFGGRADKQVKVRGFRIEPGEIEEALKKHPSVKTALVVPREDRPGVKRLVGYLVAGEGAEQPRPAALREFLAPRMPEFMVPSTFVWMEAFPLTPNGKVDVRRLPAPASDRPDLEVDYVAATRPVEKGLVELFEDVLGIRGVGTRDNFFELGGNSLLALKLLARIREERKADVPVVRFFEEPTVEAVAARLEGGSGGPATRTRRVRERRPVEAGLEDVAIVAMGGRFPGAASVPELWRNLCEGVESITFFEPGELDPSLPSALTEDPSYVRARGILRDVEMFDAAFFGIPPREAEVMDPQQRLFLEVAWEVLEEAGYVSEEEAGRIGVFGGMCTATYLWKHLITRPDLVERVGNTQVVISNDKDFLATRVAHRLNLTGPAVAVQSACSTSLVAVVEAFHSLRTHQCDLALAGGSSVTCPPRSGYEYQEGGMLSPDGHTRTFDAKARGTTFNDGVAIVALKRLGDARADGDTVYGVLKGAAINNDGGQKASYTAPSVEGQAAVIRAAQEMAGVDLRSITYVETHGTATPLGDPIEVEALAQAFREGGVTDRGFCAIGSIKSNIGHLVTAAGAAGLIKTALALTHRKIPASLGYESPNPKIDFASSPFYVNSALRDWAKGGTPLRAGVSSFGVGGTNAHVVLEEAPAPEPSGPSRPKKLLLLSARTPAALDAMTSRLREHLEARPNVDLADVAYTLMLGRRPFAHRRAVVAADPTEAVALLDGGDPLRVFTRKLETAEPELAFLFPGQGAQYVGMGATLYRDEPTYRAMVDYCAEVLEPVLGRDLRRVVFATDRDSKEAAEALRRTEITQPALFVTEYALAQLWMSWGVQPRAMIGHSVGEFVAAVLSGVMSLDDGLRLVATRGKLMASQPEGSMLSVRLDAEDVAGRLGPELTIASDNAPGLCVVAGPHEEVTKLEASLTADEVVCRALHTSHAFHSAMMDAAVEPFARHVREVALDEPQIPFVSTVSGTWIHPEEALSPEYWARHLRETVRFREGIATLLADPGRALLEVGPRGTLATLARRQSKDRSRLIVSSLADTTEGEAEWTALLQAAGQLWLADVRLDARSFHIHESRRRTPLPTYPFERKRFWIEAPADETASAVPSPGPGPQNVTTAAGPLPSATPFSVAPSMPFVAPPVQAPPAAPSQPVAFEAPVAPTPTADAPTTGAAHMSNASPSVRVHLVSKLGDLFEEVAGIEFGNGDAEVSFMELGLDSLALTQVAQQVKKAFKVDVTFRQLMENHPSLSALATHLEENMPKDLLPNDAPEATPAAQAPQGAPGAPTGTPAGAPAPAPAAGAPPSWPPAPAAGGQWPVAPVPGAMPPMTPWGLDPQSMWMMMQWFQQQQMAMWAAAQGQAPPVPGAPVGAPTPAPAPQAAPPPPAVTPEPAPAPEAPTPSDDRSTGGQVKYEAKKAFGAQTRISTSSEELTPKQKARLEAFTRRYNARTKSSKAYTQRYRKVASDPRTATGFKPALKELVYPIVAKRAKGPYLWDLDDNRYVDAINGFGSSYFGWQPDFISEAVKGQIDESLAIGPQTPLLGEVAELFCEITGSERAAFCNTGSEAVMGCMRLARTATGRSTIVIFNQSYHGIFDEVIVRATKKGKAFPASPGILPNTAEQVLVLEYGAPESLEIIRSRADDLAAVMVEPVQSRHPDLQPREFLQEIRKITADSGAAFIFDEVITGLRAGPKGAQGYFGVEADLASYGKVVGGGYPLGVISGKARFMDCLDGGHWQYGDDSIPTVGVTYFAGTMVRHPSAMAAAKAVLLHLKKEGPALQERMNARAAELAATLNREMEKLDAPLFVKNFSTLWKPTWREEQQYGDLLAFMLRDRGIHIYEGFPCFLTTAHSDEDIQTIVNAFREAVREMQEASFLPEPTRRMELDANQPPVEGARLGRDPNGDPAWYVPNPEEPGKYVKVN
jgi:amino acid adenylation domain-containing protein